MQCLCTCNWFIPAFNQASGDVITSSVSGRGSIIVTEYLFVCGHVCLCTGLCTVGYTEVHLCWLGLAYRLFVADIRYSCSSRYPISDISVPPLPADTRYPIFWHSRYPISDIRYFTDIPVLHPKKYRMSDIFSFADIRYFAFADIWYFNRYDFNRYRYPIFTKKADLSAFSIYMLSDMPSLHSSKILTIQQGVPRGNPQRPLKGFNSGSVVTGKCPV